VTSLFFSCSLFFRSFTSFVRSFVRSFPSFPSFVRSFVPSFNRSFVPSFLPSFVPSIVPSFFQMRASRHHAITPSRRRAVTASPRHRHAVACNFALLAEQRRDLEFCAATEVARLAVDFSVSRLLYLMRALLCFRFSAAAGVVVISGFVAMCSLVHSFACSLVRRSSNVVRRHGRSSSASIACAAFVRSSLLVPVV